jgi:hypothetical protein
VRKARLEDVAVSVARAAGHCEDDLPVFHNVDALAEAGQAGEVVLAGVGVGSQTELIQDGDRAGPFGGSHPASPQPDERQAAFLDDDVFHDGQAAEQPRQLIGAGQPGLGPSRAPSRLMRRPARTNLARFRPDSAVDKVEQRGLARAVGTDQPGDPARGHDETGAVDRAQPAERLH